MSDSNILSLELIDLPQQADTETFYDTASVKKPLFKQPSAPNAQLMFLPDNLEIYVARDPRIQLLSQIVDGLSISSLLDKYKGGGAPAYPPRMMLKLLLFSYSEGTFSSRRMEAQCWRDMPTKYLCESLQPDHRTIARFRRDNWAVLLELFAQVVLLCQAEGLVLLEQVAIDGTKIEARASKKQIYSPERVAIELAEVKAQMVKLLSTVEAIDQAEDTAENQQQKAKLTQECQQLGESKAKLEDIQNKINTGGGGSVVATDTESKLMKTRSGIRPGYNGQIAVDGESQVIVAVELSQDANDIKLLPAMVALTKENTGAVPKAVTADAGYSRIASLEAMEEQGIDAYVAQGKVEKARSCVEYDTDNDAVTVLHKVTGEKVVLPFYRNREHRGTTRRIYRNAKMNVERTFDGYPLSELSLQKRMYDKLQSKEGKEIYKLRQQTVEPVFGRIKSGFGFTRYRLHGLNGAKSEFYLVCIAHNLRKIMKGRESEQLMSLCWLQNLLIELILMVFNAVLDIQNCIDQIFTDKRKLRQISPAL